MGTKGKWILFLVIGLLVLSSLACVSANPSQDVPDGNDHVSGFLHGLWHGLTMVLAFIYQLVGGDVGIYDSHNDGIPYNFGFVLGVLLTWAPIASKS